MIGGAVSLRVSRVEDFFVYTVVENVDVAQGCLEFS
jgi:hypothetical protein